MTYSFIQIDLSNFLIIDKKFIIQALSKSLSTSNLSGLHIPKEFIGCSIFFFLPELLLDLTKKVVGEELLLEHLEQNRTEYNGNVNIFPNDKDIEVFKMEVISKLEILYEELVQNEAIMLNSYKFEDFLNLVKSRSIKQIPVFYKIKLSYVGDNSFYKITLFNDFITGNNNFETFSVTSNNKYIDSEKEVKDKEGIEKEEVEVIREVKKRESIVDFLQIVKNVEFTKKNESIKNINVVDPNQININANQALFENQNFKEKSLQKQSELHESNPKYASFNTLKNKVLEKNEIFFIKMFRVISWIYLLCIFAIIFLTYYTTSLHISRVNTYLLERLYFKKMKINLSYMYISTLNLKLIKNKIYTDSQCYNNCTFYSKFQMSESIDTIKSEKENEFFYLKLYDTFKQIMNKEAEISIYVQSLDNVNKVTLNRNKILDKILDYGLKLKYNLYDYYHSAPGSNDEKVF